MKLLEKYNKQANQFVKVCHRIARNMYVTGFGGNLAWKLEDNLILITPTMMNKGDIQLEDLVFIDKKGETIEGTRRPTGEKWMYMKFFEERPDIVSVLHCHAPNIGAFAIMDGPNYLMRPWYPETTHEVGPVPIVPYAEPISQKLAENFTPYLQRYNSFLMENHGIVTMSPDTIEWTLMNVELLEMTAFSLLQALGSGQKLKELTREAVRDLDNVLRKRNCPLFGAPGVYKDLEEVWFPE
ncbi:MAG: class II aldolase/adducin family protein [Cyclobacteriaceae bacterium]|nr:class II aldolase/adducin family protein [Cyclobacteriaceae bacterium]